MGAPSSCPGRSINCRPARAADTFPVVAFILGVIHKIWLIPFIVGERCPPHPFFNATGCCQPGILRAVFPHLHLELCAPCSQGSAVHCPYMFTAPISLYAGGYALADILFFTPVHSSPQARMI